ncbi:MAG: class I SAM-dependent methyltransferase [Hyphomonadaceae bacterium]
MDQPIELQQAFWDEWNAGGREQRLSDISTDQKEVVLGWLDALGRTDLDIIEVGCGAGWLCPGLKAFGRVTATDLSADVLERARQRVPGVEFVAGDFMTLGFAAAGYDVVIALEVLAHVADQPAFVARLAHLLRPGGLVMLATQNRPVLERYNRIPPPRPGNLRRWVDRSELVQLLEPHFEVRDVLQISPRADRGVLRLIAGRQARRLMRIVSGRSLERVIAAAGLGWTLMALAQKRA